MTTIVRIGIAFFTLVAGAAKAASVALIIDDMGNSAKDAEAFTLPAKVTFAILPHTPYSTRFSSLALQQSREVMLHMPMESLHGKRLGPGALNARMSDIEISDVLKKALLSVPNAVGLNNHMGSKLTQLTRPMQTTMDFLQRRNMFFIDSRTTRFSKAERIASQQGVLNTRRHVFLDHVDETQAIDFQFQRLLHLARKHGHAVGIGHPYPNTIAYLQQRLAELPKLGITLVSVSHLLNQQQTQLAQAKAVTVQPGLAPQE